MFEGRSPGSAGLLAIGVGKRGALSRNTVDAGRFVTHQPLVIGADIAHPDIVAKDHQDIRLRSTGKWKTRTKRDHERQASKPLSCIEHFLFSDHRGDSAATQ